MIFASQRDIQKSAAVAALFFDESGLLYRLQLLVCRTNLDLLYVNVIGGRIRIRQCRRIRGVCHNSSVAVTRHIVREIDPNRAIRHAGECVCIIICEGDDPRIWDTIR